MTEEIDMTDNVMEYDGFVRSLSGMGFNYDSDTKCWMRGDDGMPEEGIRQLLQYWPLFAGPALGMMRAGAHGVRVTHDYETQNARLIAISNGGKCNVEGCTAPIGNGLAHHCEEHRAEKLVKDVEKREGE